MAMNARWGRAGWGRTPGTLRRRLSSPTFLHRDDEENHPSIVGTNWEGRLPMRRGDSEIDSAGEWGSPDGPSVKRLATESDAIGIETEMST